MVDLLDDEIKIGGGLRPRLFQTQTTPNE